MAKFKTQSENPPERLQLTLSWGKASLPTPQLEAAVQSESEPQEEKESDRECDIQSDAGSEYGPGYEDTLDEFVEQASQEDGRLVVPMTNAEILVDVNKQLRQKTISPKVRKDLILLQQFGQQLLKSKEYRANKLEASLLVARCNHKAAHGVYLARRIRAIWYYYKWHRGLTVESRGGKRDDSYLDDEVVWDSCKEWLAKQKIGTVTPAFFRRWINEDLFPKMRHIEPSPKSISENTIYDWLRRLGFYVTSSKKGYMKMVMKGQML